MAGAVSGRAVRRTGTGPQAARPGRRCRAAGAAARRAAALDQKRHNSAADRLIRSKIKTVQGRPQTSTDLLSNGCAVQIRPRLSAVVVSNGVSKLLAHNVDVPYRSGVLGRANGETV